MIYFMIGCVVALVILRQLSPEIHVVAADGGDD